MAAVHEAGQGRSFGHAPHELGKDLIIMNLSSLFVIHRDERFIIAEYDL